MHPAICAGPWWWTKLSPPSASNAAATTYSCSAVRGAVGACVAAGRRGCVSRQGTWGSSCASHAATGPMVTVTAPVGLALSTRQCFYATNRERHPNVTVLPPSHLACAGPLWPSNLDWDRML